MSQSPPPTPPGKPTPPGSQQRPVSAPPPVLASVPASPAARNPLDRHLGDLSDAEIAALLPLEEEDAENYLSQDDPKGSSAAPHAPPPPAPGGRPAALSSSVPPPIRGATPPPSPTKSQGVVSLVPPPVAGEELHDEEKIPASPKKTQGLTSQQKTLIGVLSASLVIGLLIAALALILSPDRNRRIDPNAPVAPVHVPAVSEPGTERHKGGLDLRDAEEIQFIEPVEEEIH